MPANDPVTTANFERIIRAMLADQAVVLQQIEAMDPFDDGFDERTDEVEEQFTAVSEQLPELMDFAGAHTGDEAEAMWVPVRQAVQYYIDFMATLTPKIQLANAIRGRGED